MTTPLARFTRRLVSVLGLAGALLPLAAQVTESPHTVAPGELLVEMDGVKLSYDRADAAGNKHTAVGVASTILTAGLTRSVDLQVGFDLFLRRSFDFGGARDSRSGIGDVSFRTKWTFWRDERRSAALAVIPYVKLPTNSGGVGRNGLEGGFILPWAAGGSGPVTSGAMLGWDVVRNDDDNGYDAQWYTSGFVQRNLTKSLAVYAETTFSVASTGLADWEGTMGAGVLLHLTTLVQLDYELQRGINRRAADWTHTLRVNWGW